MYKEEIKLNEDFQTFVSNIRRAYEGLNTARDQIKSENRDGDVIKLAIYSLHHAFLYSLIIEYSAGSECLPLGPRFQEHIAFFVG